MRNFKVYKKFNYRLLALGVSGKLANPALKAVVFNCQPSQELIAADILIETPNGYKMRDIKLQLLAEEEKTNQADIDVRVSIPSNQVESHRPLKDFLKAKGIPRPGAVAVFLNHVFSSDFSGQASADTAVAHKVCKEGGLRQLAQDLRSAGLITNKHSKNYWSWTATVYLQKYLTFSKAALSPAQEIAELKQRLKKAEDDVNGVKGELAEVKSELEEVKKINDINQNDIKGLKHYYKESWLVLNKGGTDVYSDKILGTESLLNKARNRVEQVAFYENNYKKMVEKIQSLDADNTELKNAYNKLRYS